jgi:hypothetical protein
MWLYDVSATPLSTHLLIDLFAKLPRYTTGLNQPIGLILHPDGPRIESACAPIPATSSCRTMPRYGA